jgi:hypothetical protein
MAHARVLKHLRVLKKVEIMVPFLRIENIR